MMRNILSVVAGVAVAFAVMMGFEFANSRLYPFPPGMDVFDAAQVRAFAASMPLSAVTTIRSPSMASTAPSRWPVRQPKR